MQPMHRKKIPLDTYQPSHGKAITHHQSGCWVAVGIPVSWYPPYARGRSVVSRIKAPQVALSFLLCAQNRLAKLMRPNLSDWRLPHVMAVCSFQDKGTCLVPGGCTSAAP